MPVQKLSYNMWLLILRITSINLYLQCTTTSAILSKTSVVASCPQHEDYLFCIFLLVPLFSSGHSYLSFANIAPGVLRSFAIYPQAKIWIYFLLPFLQTGTSTLFYFPSKCKTQYISYFQFMLSSDIVRW